MHYIQCYSSDMNKVLKHVKAWLKPNLHKIRKTVITLPGCTTVSLTNLDDLNIVRPIDQ